VKLTEPVIPAVNVIFALPALINDIALAGSAQAMTNNMNVSSRACFFILADGLSRPIIFSKSFTSHAIISKKVTLSSGPEDLEF
jgi:hypothetical protein